jgi:hypothetical protein
MLPHLGHSPHTFMRIVYTSQLTAEEFAAYRYACNVTYHVRLILGSLKDVVHGQIPLR